MRRRGKDTVDIRELLRRFHKGESDRAISRAIKIDRKTVGRYRSWAVSQGLTGGDLPSLGDLERLAGETLSGPAPPQNTSSVVAHGEMVRKLREQQVEIAAIHQRLMERGYRGSYSSVYRFVRRLDPAEPEATVRVECAPGEEAQVDFGYGGLLVDPETGSERKSWAFVMTLSWSRHQYVEFVFDQKVETWLRLHRNGFEFFGGVPQRVVPDNLKAAILRGCWHEPEAHQGYRECAEHYDFLIAPCRPGTPRHKGKVEQGGVHYVKRNFLGGREPTGLTQANRDVLDWVMQTAGTRIHGTTRERPLDRFAEERRRLKPLPTAPYDMAIWKQLKVGRDCHVYFEQAYYSVPFRLVGENVRVRGGCRSVTIYTANYEVAATHDRADRPGRRMTQLDHLPQHKIPGLTVTRESCREKAAHIGPATQEVVEGFLAHRPEDRLRTAGRLLGLAKGFSPERLESACRRALSFGDWSYKTVKSILEQRLECEPVEIRCHAPGVLTFVRSGQELLGHLTGGAPWK